MNIFALENRGDAQDSDTRPHEPYAWMLSTVPPFSDNVIAFNITVLRGNKGHKFSPEIAHCPLLVPTVPYWSRLFFFCQKYV